MPIHAIDSREPPQGRIRRTSAASAEAESASLCELEGSNLVDGLGRIPSPTVYSRWLGQYAGSLPISDRRGGEPSLRCQFAYSHFVPLDLKWTSTFMVCVMDAATPRTAVELACNLDEIDVADRPRYQELSTRVRAAMWDRAELPDGYVLSLDTEAVSVADVSEWIALERRCCPFLSVDLAIRSSQRLTLTISGPTGAKTLIETAFAAVTPPGISTHLPHNPARPFHS
jgi:hypothetical protein